MSNDDIDILLDLIRRKYKSVKKQQLHEQYINKLVARGVPPIFSFRHLADIVGIPPRDLYGMAFHANLYYKKFKIPKRSGGERKILAPNPILDSIQRWIGKEIINCGFEGVIPQVIGYIPGKNIKDHLIPHQQSSCLVKFDLKDFFPSISIHSVCNLFLELGYVESVSRTLSALLTYAGGLPQGASTSPAISNLYMRKFDSDMADYCRNNELIYTRYADDIVVSGGENLHDKLSRLKEFFPLHGLNLNHAKTRFYKNKSSIRFITGLILSQGEIRLPKAMRRRIRVQCHLFLRELDKMTTVGVSLRDKKIPTAWRDKELVFDPVFPERIIGKLNYWIHIEPENNYAVKMKNLIVGKLDAL